MNFNKDGNSFCAETEPCKPNESFIATASNLKSPLNINSEETSPYKSFYSSGSPLLEYSQGLSETAEVFNRLAADTNRRFDRKQRLSEYIKQKEIATIKRFSENEQVYERLLKDTQQRKEKQEINQKWKAQDLENTLRSFRTDKTCNKEEADAIVKRLLSKEYSDSSKKIVELEYSYKKQRDLTRFLSFDSLEVKERTERKKSMVKEKDEMGILERTEIEQRYGKPGRPPNLEESKKVVLRKAKSGEGSGMMKVVNKKSVQSQKNLVSPRIKPEIKREIEKGVRIAKSGFHPSTKLNRKP